MKEKTKNNLSLLRRCSTIMLLDDEAMLLNAIEKYLKAKKFKVITCQSAEEALQRIKKEKIRKERRNYCQKDTRSKIFSHY